MARALLDVPQLSHEVARGATRDRRYVGQPHEIRPVPGTTRRRLPPRLTIPFQRGSTSRDEVLALPDAAGRHIGDESGSRIPVELRLFRVFRDFESVSTTLIQRMYRIDAKYSAAASTSLSVRAFASPAIVFVLAFLGSALRRFPLRKSSIWRVK